MTIEEVAILLGNKSGSHEDVTKNASQKKIRITGQIQVLERRNCCSNALKIDGFSNFCHIYFIYVYMCMNF
jgi:hypothetical protein